MLVFYIVKILSKKLDKLLLPLTPNAYVARLDYKSE